MALDYRFRVRGATSVIAMIAAVPGLTQILPASAALAAPAMIVQTGIQSASKSEVLPPPIVMPPPPAPPSGAMVNSRLPQPQGNPGSWATTSDYPPEAMQNGWEGITRFALETEKDGAVTSCSVTESSGYDVLDQATCELMMERAEFKPAKDEAGVAIPAVWNSAVSWELPQNAPHPIIPLEWFVSFTATKEGRIADCEAFIRFEGGTILEAAEYCEKMPKIVPPFLDDNDNAIARRVSMEFKITTEPIDVPEDDD